MKDNQTLQNGAKSVQAHASHNKTLDGRRQSDVSSTQYQQLQIPVRIQPKHYLESQSRHVESRYMFTKNVRPLWGAVLYRWIGKAVILASLMLSGVRLANATCLCLGTAGNYAI